jgi:hypothetical protein
LPDLQAPKLVTGTGNFSSFKLDSAPHEPRQKKDTDASMLTDFDVIDFITNKLATPIHDSFLKTIGQNPISKPFHEEGQLPQASTGKSTERSTIRIISTFLNDQVRELTRIILRISLNKGLSTERNSVIASVFNEPSRTGGKKSCPGVGSCHMQLLQGKSLYHQDGD